MVNVACMTVREYGAVRQLSNYEYTCWTVKRLSITLERRPSCQWKRRAPWRLIQQIRIGITHVHSKPQNGRRMNNGYYVVTGERQKDTLSQKSLYSTEAGRDAEENEMKKEAGRWKKKGNRGRTNQALRKGVSQGRRVV
jgi:hypothetical protein